MLAVVGVTSAVAFIVTLFMFLFNYDSKMLLLKGIINTKILLRI